MPEYTPSMKAEQLASDPGVGSFFIEDPTRPGEVPPVMIPDPKVPVYFHGYFLVDTDQNLVFSQRGVLGAAPFSLTYMVGFFYEGTNEFSPIGNRNRTPVMVRGGRFRPDIIIGDKWVVGRYAIRWTYRMYEWSAEMSVDTLFWVRSAGTSARVPHPPVFEIGATVVVLPYEDEDV